MSVEKVDFQKVIHERIPYTLVYTKVIQSITYPLAGFLWIYLLSLPSGWNINKQHLKKHFKFGDNVLKRVLSYLHQANLIEYVRNRDAQGKILDVSINVLCGDKFVLIQEVKDCASTGLEINRVDSESSGFGGHIKEIKEIKENKKKIKDISCASDDARDRSFETFWELYPRKKDKARAKAVWQKDKLGLIASRIFEDIKNRRVNDEQWNDEKFIPHPSTYLSNKRWEDEIEKKDSKKREVKNKMPFKQQYKPQEPRCTVKWWDATHPNHKDYKEPLKKDLTNVSQGSEIRRNNSRGNGVRKAESYLPSIGSMG